MSQQKLAEKVGCSEAWLCRVLNMQAVGSDELIERISQETGIARKTLYCGPKDKIKRQIGLYLRREKVNSMKERDQQGAA